MKFKSIVPSEQTQELPETLRSKVLFAVLGLLAGTVSGTFGVGGGVVIIPYLTLLFAMQPFRAIQFSIFGMLPVALAGTISHILVNEKNIQLVYVLYLSVGSIGGSYFGSRIVHKVNKKFLTILMILFFLFIGLRYMSGWTSWDENLWQIKFPLRDLAGFPWTVMLLGILIGMVVILLGIGGGILMTPILNQVYALSVPQAVATSLATISITLMFSLYFRRHAYAGNRWALGYLGGGSLIGALAGAFLTIKIDPLYIQTALAILVFYAAVDLVKKFRQ